MDKKTLVDLVVEICKSTPGNIMTSDIAISENEVGLVLYESPIVGFASANDLLFDICKEINVVGPWFMSPEEWLPDARTVISLFFPLTEVVRSSNRNRTDTPSNEWLHGRIEGQKYINACMMHIRNTFVALGNEACVPFIDDRFRSIKPETSGTKYDELIDDKIYSSNWSERHAAYAAGLGTFGLSKCLITEKGAAGRFASIIVNAAFEPDHRSYTGIYEYCTNCGQCARNCPARAIDPEKGKNKDICSDYMNKIKPQINPRHGCGLCYVDVPCEACNPKNRL